MQSFTAIYFVGFNGNDSVDFSGNLTIATVISDGNGCDFIQLDNGNNVVTVGTATTSSRVADLLAGRQWQQHHCGG